MQRYLIQKLSNWEEKFLIYITGDTHADFRRFENKVIKKIKKDDYLIICGDFGFIWDDSKKENSILKKIGNFKFKTLFVDGTHENFDLLEKYEKESFCEGTARHICGNLYQLLRGQVYNIDKRNIFTFGGGESKDKDLKINMNNWWAEEMPKLSEMKTAVENLNKVNRTVDFIVSHEPPGKLKTIIDCSDAEVNTLNRFFDDVTKEVKFKHWFFGSTHLNKEFTIKYISVFDDIIKI